MFCVLFIIYLIPFVPLMRWKRSHNFLHWLRRWFTKLQLLLSGVIIRKRSLGDLPPAGAIFCYNHSSILDILIPIASIGRQIRFIGKKELARIPLFGIVFRTLDISIDRESSSRSYDALQHAAELLDRGVDVFIAPEGTTSIKAPDLLPFRNGAFWLAERAEADVVPVVYLDNYRFHYDKKYDGRPGVFRMTLGQVIPVSNAQQMKSETRVAMEAILQGAKT